MSPAETLPYSYTQLSPESLATSKQQKILSSNAWRPSWFETLAGWGNIPPSVTPYTPSVWGNAEPRWPGKKKGECVPQGSKPPCQPNGAATSLQHLPVSRPGGEPVRPPGGPQHGGLPARPHQHPVPPAAVHPAGPRRRRLLPLPGLRRQHGQPVRRPRPPGRRLPRPR